jgi:hypothetical protein
MIRCLLVAALACTVPAHAAGPNLLPNGGFHDSTAGWDDPPPWLSWSTADHRGSPNSGSGRTELFVPGSHSYAYSEFEASTCIVLQPGDSYVVHGSVWVDEAGAEDEVGFGFKLFYDEVCQSGYFPKYWLAESATAGWQAGSLEIGNPGSDVRSLQVMLYSRDNQPLNPVRAYYDGFELRPGACAQGFPVDLGQQVWRGSRSLCLNDGRFRVTADWRTPSGQEGEGVAVPFSTDSGSFWFFGPNNLEIDVKVLDGCKINGHYWVFAAGLTDVEVTLTVIDTANDDRQTYHNPQKSTFVTITDVEAFATCP